MVQAVVETLLQLKSQNSTNNAPMLNILRSTIKNILGKGNSEKELPPS